MTKIQLASRIVQRLDCLAPVDPGTRCAIEAGQGIVELAHEVQCMVIAVNDGVGCRIELGRKLDALAAAAMRLALWAERPE